MSYEPFCASQRLLCPNKPRGAQAADLGWWLASDNFLSSWEGLCSREEAPMSARVSQLGEGTLYLTQCPAQEGDPQATHFVQEESAVCQKAFRIPTIQSRSKEVSTQLLIVRTS